MVSTHRCTPQGPPTFQEFGDQFVLGGLRGLERRWNKRLTGSVDMTSLSIERHVVYYIAIRSLLSCGGVELRRSQ